MNRASGDAAARATEKLMAYRPATLERLPETNFKPCACAGCTELATHVLIAGGAPQFKSCVSCGKRAIEADRRAPGKGWNG